MKRLNGIRLPLRKKTEDKPVAALPLPQYVRIPMLMHRGTPCVPTVEPDDYVTVGQVIGKPADDMAVPIHASVSGTVTAIADYTLPDGNVVPCIEIESDGNQTV
ncbi:MAG TPA: electron transport complex subunit RsxC, partial [Ruminococcus sp.]|nr:electron transport complex subunit RsxC [Ruminococcus sp.]